MAHNAVVSDEWELTENLHAAALSTGWLWNRAVDTQAERILSGRDQIQQQVDVWLLIVSVRQVERAAMLAQRQAKSHVGASIMKTALAEFRLRVPGVVKARDAIEHFDEYLAGVGDRQQPDVNPRRSRNPDEELSLAWRTAFHQTPGAYVYLVGDNEVDVPTARRATQALVEAMHAAGNATD
jgi:hypothetical protein